MTEDEGSDWHAMQIWRTRQRQQQKNQKKNNCSNESTTQTIFEINDCEKAFHFLFLFGFHALRFIIKLTNFNFLKIQNIPFSHKSTSFIIFKQKTPRHLSCINIRIYTLMMIKLCTPTPTITAATKYNLISFIHLVSKQYFEYTETVKST